MKEKTTYKPRLRHCTLLAGVESDPITMIVGRSYYKINPLNENRDKFLEIKSLFDGRHTIHEISDKTLVSVKDIEGILNQFSILDILRKEEPSPTIRNSIFVEKLSESCDMWQKQIGFHALFSKLQKGEVRKEVFLGWLLESYHYVRSAPVHTAAALANCKNEEWKEILTQYFIDEHDHSQLYLEALMRMGLKKNDIENAHPIIGTMSLINMLCEIGRQSTLGYLACTGLFEAKKSDYKAARQDFLNISKVYGYSLSEVEPIIDHMKQDVEADHKSLLAEALHNTPHVEATEAHYAVNCVHDLKHAFDNFHDQVSQYYSDISNYIPRLKVDYFSL